MLTIITSPVAGDNPFGTNINYDADFDIIKNEIAKLGGTDYELLEKTAVKLLKEKSKDIRVLSFLSFSYLRSDNWENFSDIWDGLGTLVEQNYDGLFPDRDRAKQNAFKWLAEDRYTILIGEKKPTEDDYEHIARMLVGLTKIKPILEQKFPDGSPFPSALFTAVQRWEKSCKPKPKEEPPPSPPPAPSSDASSTASAASSGAATPAAPKPAAGEGALGPMETTSQAQQHIRKIAQFLIEKEPVKIMGYRMMRSVRWDIFEKAPPAEGGKTRLPGPNEQQRTYFQKLVNEKDWKTLITKGEAAFVSGGTHLWLDLQRYIATACGELGSEYGTVKNCILSEIALLLKRIPELPDLMFADGTPFCDEVTKDWIGSEVKPMLQSTADDASGGGGGGADPLVEEQRTVNQMVGAGQLEQALAMVQANLRSSSGERDNFRRTIMIGSLLLKAKQPDIAISVLESLDQKIDQYSLDTWDPDLAVEAWAALTSAYKVGKVQKPQNIVAALQEKQNAVLSKIGQIDPVRAFSLSK